MNKRQNKHKDGCFGRSLGHIEILKYAIKNKLTHIIISEDDVKFLDIPKLKSDLDLFLASNIEWNVLLLQGLNYKPYEKVNKLPWVGVSDCEAPGCYLVHGDYFETLLKNFVDGYSLLDQSFDHPNDNLTRFVKQSRIILQNMVWICTGNFFKKQTIGLFPESLLVFKKIVIVTSIIVLLTTRRLAYLFIKMG
jgi:hypothetical protein